MIGVGITAIREVTSLIVTAAEPEANKRPQTESSDLVGDYNSRTGKLDAGTDPNGWYEDDR